MITDKKALECVQTFARFCGDQPNCQNCILHLYSPAGWDCYVNGFLLQDDMRLIEGQYEGKKMNHGYAF